MHLSSCHKDSTNTNPAALRATTCATQQPLQPLTSSAAIRFTAGYGSPSTPITISISERTSFHSLTPDEAADISSRFPILGSATTADTHHGSFTVDNTRRYPFVQSCAKCGKWPPKAIRASDIECAECGVAPSKDLLHIVGTFTATTTTAQLLHVVVADPDIAASMFSTNFDTADSSDLHTQLMHPTTGTFRFQHTRGNLLITSFADSVNKAARTLVLS
jgi:hypothetical protein